MKRIIFPGSFDPIHYGHLSIAQNALEALGADVVTFLLSPSTVWKKVDTPFVKRETMIKLALEDYPAFEMSNIEQTNEGKTNYTFYSLERLKALYPDDELYLLFGSDQANEFHRWKNPLEIIKLAQVVVYKRPGAKLNQANLHNYNMKVIEGPMRSTSSTLVRHFASLDIPFSVLDYIITEKLYFAREIAKRMSNKRYMHSYEVAKVARLIALSNRKNAAKAFKAGMLHDIAKEVPAAKLQELMGVHFKKYAHLDPWTHHQFIGAYIAKHDFAVKDKEILNAIKFHASGRGRMNWLMKVIYAADVIEPTRGYDSNSLIAACIDNLDLGFQQVLKENQIYLKEKNIKVNNELSLACIKRYL
ncbi:MAG TPA: nicotinate (nicotinamide) nucleotide adenylyltransferase [Bacilli bacterium]|nr:nicotinate (nicotinamide) nucleotide adenylyltransferase [Bacilli bacterium]